MDTTDPVTHLTSRDPSTLINEMYVWLTWILGKQPVILFEFIQTPGGSIVSGGALKSSKKLG